MHFPDTPFEIAFMLPRRHSAIVRPFAPRRREQSRACRASPLQGVHLRRRNIEERFIALATPVKADGRPANLPKAMRFRQGVATLLALLAKTRFSCAAKGQNFFRGFSANTLFFPQNAPFLQNLFIFAVTLSFK
ncbi:MAG TPA: hypothetical protein IAC72_05360 [Candidatus Fimimonas merdipullorum]|uniref:Uncharacterized protein n=1 Tax=Candidatus Fimimonas merdipullorum TaxID=2840822 RepID=A0A9D1MY41_9BACT|nr:hypothetical protein [Candidatus Fimimonas merdipullorum]